MLGGPREGEGGLWKSSTTSTLALDVVRELELKMDSPSTSKRLADLEERTGTKHEENVLPTLGGGQGDPGGYPGTCYCTASARSAPARASPPRRGGVPSAGGGRGGGELPWRPPPPHRCGGDPSLFRTARPPPTPPPGVGLHVFRRISTSFTHVHSPHGSRPHLFFLKPLRGIFAPFGGSQGPPSDGVLGSQDSGAGVARAWRGLRPLFGLGGAGVARAWGVARACRGVKKNVFFLASRKHV
eukprot:gene25651-biopygen10531